MNEKEKKTLIKLLGKLKTVFEGINVDDSTFSEEVDYVNSALNNIDDVIKTTKKLNQTIKKLSQK